MNYDDEWIVDVVGKGTNHIEITNHIKDIVSYYIPNFLNEKTNNTIKSRSFIAIIIPNSSFNFLNSEWDFYSKRLGIQNFMEF